MTKNLLVEIIKKLQQACRKSKVKIAFSGGIAVGFYGLPRATYDVDGFISLAVDDLSAVIKVLEKAGFEIYDDRLIKTIEDRKYISLLFSEYKMYVDLFIAQGEFQEGLIKRARNLKFDAVNIKVVSPEDLILLKLQAGREKDLDDVRGILQENYKVLNLKYLKKWAKKLGVLHFLNDELESLRI